MVNRNPFGGLVRDRLPLLMRQPKKKGRFNMRILEKMYNLEAGTIIDRPHKGDIIKLTSEYNNGHYDYIELDMDENGNLVETNIEGVVTPSDLINGEVV